jgi:hypothetical protein
MDQISILAKNDSGGDPHMVTFIHDDGRVKISCNCPMGKNGELCEHKIRLASNDLMLLDNPSQRGRLFEAHVWIIQSGIADPLLELMRMYGEEEPDIEAIKKQEGKVARLMKEGA